VLLRIATLDAPMLFLEAPDDNGVNERTKLEWEQQKVSADLLRPPENLERVMERAMDHWS
jgi:hypothetical protein